MNLQQNKRLVVRTFGTFEVLLDGDVLPFEHQTLGKELLALLVAARGYKITAVAAYSFIARGHGFGRGYIQYDGNYYRNCLRQLISELERVNMRHVLIATDTPIRNCFINTSYFDCDYYRHLDGVEIQPHAKERFLEGYAWGRDLFCEDSAALGLWWNAMAQDRNYWPNLIKLQKNR